MEIDVSPDMSMYGVIRNQSYEVESALAEFIDNSIQASLNANIKKVKVDIKYYTSEYSDLTLRNSLHIIDNGPGITPEKLQTVMKPGRRNDSGGLHEFGIGMKSAAVWFSTKWNLQSTSSSMKINKKINLDFDLQTLLKTGSDKVVITPEKVDSKTTGTTLSLYQIDKQINDFDALCSNLRDFYQFYTYGISSFLELNIHKDDVCNSLKYDIADPEVLNSPEARTIAKKYHLIGGNKSWVESINVMFMNKNVTGKIFLRKTGSYTDNPGLTIVRNNRVILGTTKKHFKPVSLYKTSNKYGAQRISAIINIDGLPVSFTKDALLFNIDDLIKEILKCEKISALVKQASEYRADKKAEDTIITEQSPDKKSISNTEPQKKTEKNKRETKPVNEMAWIENLKKGTDSLILKTIIDEFIYQYKADRPIACSAALRIILEVQLHKYLRDNHASIYFEKTDLKDDGIQALLNYVYGNLNRFNFERNVESSIKILMKNKHVVDLNQQAHGNIILDKSEIKNILANTQSLLCEIFKPMD